MLPVSKFLLLPLAIKGGLWGKAKVLKDEGMSNVTGHPNHFLTTKVRYLGIPFLLQVSE